MTNSIKYLPTVANAALISIHPGYAEKIISGEKRLEFRRSWAVSPVDLLVIYATAPVQRVVALAEVGQVIRGSKTKLWELARDDGGGISRRKLFAYLDGKQNGIALQLLRRLKIGDGIDPHAIFGPGFRPPQSFRYLMPGEFEMLAKHIKGKIWE